MEVSANSETVAVPSDIAALPFKRKWGVGRGGGGAGGRGEERTEGGAGECSNTFAKAA